MKNTVKSILLLQFMLFCASVYAQSEGGIVFDKTSHYFGTFTKSRGKVSHKFEFTNRLNKPVIITNVKSTCGCTATKYTREPILPGKKGYAVVRFDPAKFSGYFSKKVSVYTNTNPQPVHLAVSGRIRVNHKVNDAFKHHIGDLRADKKTINFDDVQKHAAPINREIKMINIMRDSVRMRVINYPNWLQSCRITKNDLTQGDNTRLMTVVKADNLSQWGHLSGNIELEIERGVKTEVKRVPVDINLIDDFSVLSEDKKDQAPQIYIDNDTLHVISKVNKISSKKLFLYNRVKQIY